VTIFPSPMTNPATRQPQPRDENHISLTIGTVAYDGYAMENNWEVLPGPWTFQIWYQDQKLAEQTFTVR